MASRIQFARAAKKRAWAFGAAAVALAFTVAMPFVVGDRPGSAAQAALFVVLSATFQIIGSYLFSRETKYSSEHAAAHFRRIAMTITRVQSIRKRAEDANDRNADAKAIRTAIGTPSVSLSFIEEDLGEIAEDFVQIYPEAQVAVENNRETESES